MNMRETLVLVKAASRGDSRLRQMLGLMEAGTRRTTKIVHLLLIISVAVALAAMLFFLGLNYLQLEMIGNLAGIRGVSWFVGSLLAALVTFVFALFSSGSILYHGSDMPLLMSLPVDSSTVLASRLVLHYRTHLLFHSIIFIPAQTVHLWSNGLSAFAIGSGLIQLILVPFLPICLSLVVMHLFMGGRRAGGRGRESWAIGILLVIMVVAQGFASRWMQSGMDTTDMQRIASSYQGVFSTMRHYLFLNRWMADMALGIRFTQSFMGLVLVVAASVFLTIVLILRSYGDTVLRLGEMENRTDHRSSKVRVTSVGASVFITLIRREFSLINARPAFKMELYAEAGIPLILAVVYVISGTLDEISQAVELVRTLEVFPFIICGILAIMAGFSMMSSTSFSREGHLLAASRLFPVTPQVFVRAKLAAHMLLFYGSYVLFTMLSVLLFSITLYHLTWMLTLGASVIATNACIGLAIDAWRPRLEWKLPQQAVKQNLNGVIGMALSALHIVFLAAMVYLLVFVAGFSTLAGALILVVPSLILFAGTWHIAIERAQRLYAPA